MSLDMPRKTRPATARTLPARDARGRFVALEIVEVADLAPVAVAAPVAPLRCEVAAPRLAPAAPVLASAWLPLALAPTVAPARSTAPAGVDIATAAVLRHRDRAEHALERRADRRFAVRKACANLAVFAGLVVACVGWAHHVHIW
jgi:hypothetical protein